MTDVYVTSAFSKNNSGGNKAGVVLQADTLSELQKRNLAAKAGFSETAFLSASACADCKIEYFTPKGEVPLCGHATIASFVTLHTLGRLKALRHAAPALYSIETKSGVLKVEVEQDGMVFMEQNCPVFDRCLEPGVLEPCFPVAVSDKRYPIQIVSTGLRDILLPVDSVGHLQEAVPDFGAMAEISRQQNVVGVHAFALVNSAQLTAVCRNFAPLYGIDEESATGTSNCALACYLFMHGMHGIGNTRYIFEQGHNLGSVSQIIVRLETEQDTITKVTVGGYGYLMERTSFREE